MGIGALRAGVREDGGVVRALRDPMSHDHDEKTRHHTPMRREAT
jgi:hypothetical protein